MEGFDEGGGACASSSQLPPGGDRSPVDREWRSLQVGWCVLCSSAHITDAPQHRREGVVSSVWRALLRCYRRFVPPLPPPDGLGLGVPMSHSLSVNVFNIELPTLSLTCRVVGAATVECHAGLSGDHLGV